MVDPAVALPLPQLEFANHDDPLTLLDAAPDISREMPEGLDGEPVGVAVDPDIVGAVEPTLRGAQAERCSPGSARRRRASDFRGHESPDGDDVVHGLVLT